MKTISPPPVRTPIKELPREWQDWFNAVLARINAVPSSGTTANRPTTGVRVGEFYFDTTINKPIWVKTVSPIVWIDATGAAV